MQIALVGSAPSSVTLAPFKDASYAQFVGGKQPDYPPSPFIDEKWEIWGCSPGAWAAVPRADRWFEVHRWEPGAPWLSPQYVEFLRHFTGPVYTGGPIPDIVNHVVYPIERVEEVFSSYFLHSSLSLMMALAILEIEDARKGRATVEDDTIGMWGVDMAATEEYSDQRSGCQFFILEALRRGIQVFIPPESCLLRPKPIYGLSEWDHAYIKCTQRAKELNQRKQDAAARLQEAQAQVQFLSGAVDDLNYFVNTWTSPYGLPPGVKLRHEQGTGLGGGITKPSAPQMPALQPEPSNGQVTDLGEMHMLQRPKKRKDGDPLEVEKHPERFVQGQGRLEGEERYKKKIKKKVSRRK